MPKPEHLPKASGAQAGFQNWRTLDTDFSIFREGWIGIKLNLKLSCRKHPGDSGLPGSSTPLPLTLLQGV